MRVLLLLTCAVLGTAAATPEGALLTFAQRSGLSVSSSADCSATEQQVRAMTRPQNQEAGLDFVTMRAFSGRTLQDMERSLDAAALADGLNALDGWSLEARPQQAYASESEPGYYVHVQLIPGPATGGGTSCLTVLRRHQD